jgi:phosphinothricin acetyltransferase
MSEHRNSFTTRMATSLDAAAIAEIYNQGIADRIATFETEPRNPSQIVKWFRPGVVVVVAEADEAIVAFGASFPYSSRPCYAGVGEYSIYVGRDHRRKVAGTAVLRALIEAARLAGMRKLTSRIFPENTASRELMRRFGFSEIGVHRRHGKLDGHWRDCVVVELLIDEGMG